MSTSLQSLQCKCNPQCKGVFSPYAPFRGLGATPALGRWGCKSTATDCAIPHVFHLRTTLGL